MANLWQATKQLATAAANNIAASQSPGAGAITLNGSLVSGGVATLDTPRRVLITSAGNDSGITFTVVGTNYSGAALTETVTGINIGAVATSQDFATVTSVTHTGTVAGAITIGTNGVGSTPWFVVDREQDPMNFGLCVVVSGTVTYTVEYTYDDPNEPYTGTFPTTFSLAGMTSRPLTGDAVIQNPITAIRATVESGTDSIRAIVIQAR
jgi:hypothetical protein